MDFKLLAVICRGVLIFVLAAMSIMFWRKYAADRNKFFFGYFIFFFFMALTDAAIFLGEVLNFMFQNNTLTDLMGLDFPNFEENRDRLGLIFNLVRPPYLLALMILYIAFASQLQPLEIVLNQKSHLISRGLYLAVGLTILIYIPAMTYTLYTQIIVYFSLLLLIVGLFGNIGLNLYLAVRSPGKIRRRSYLVLIGFVLFIIGLLWSLKLGWSETLNPAWNFEIDVVIGSLISTISAFCYYLGFKGR